jgi:hypothetical protein
MIACRSCSADNPDESKFCSECGAALSDEYAPTEVPVSSGESSLLSSSSDSHHGRFLPGTKIADRYRIVSLVGKGGMGEVYRADDLKLGHTVALKFLPKELADDPQRLEYFHSEVRLTRQISHPNVCRVYDIGEADGQLFLSMEYIDGEDLRVLLRRIGKLPQDKGIQIAQQLCAGLAAAHEKGVLHRDLKPANIMLDGRGQVRITDFGLAKLAEEGTAGEIAGTPAYMAPEQLTRGEATIQSDLYSLGLVLYELFTGEAARKAGTVPELIRANEESSLSQTLELPGDIDPAVQRAISRCLEREPHERPISANAVAASLPGGDPLAAALAAGETPSPELVAAAGESGLLSLRAASIYLGIVLVGLALLVPLKGAKSPAHGLRDSAEVFAGEARKVLAELGHGPAENAPRYETYQFVLSEDEATEKREILEFWYRCSPNRIFRQVAPDDFFNLRSLVTPTNPPPVTEGMASLLFNREQALRELYVVPPLERENAQRLSDIADEKLLTHELSEIRDIFDKAGLTLTERGALTLLSAADAGHRESVVRPPFPVDEFFVFPPDDVQFQQTEEDNARPSIARVELGRAEGQVVYFKAVQPAITRPSLSPWRTAPPPPLSWPDFWDSWKSYREEQSKPQSERDKTAAAEYYKQAQGILIGIIKGWLDNLAWTISLLFLPLTMVLAWRNTVLGRSDRRTAWRVAVFIFCVVLLGDRLNCGLTLEMFRSSLQLSAGVAFQLGIYYLALEPIIRKFWPGILTVWSRAMTGRWHDPSLGQSLLIGAMAGTLLQVLYGILVGSSMEFHGLALSGNMGILAVVMQLIRFVSGWGLYVTFVLVLCRMAARRNWPAAVLAAAALIGFWHFKVLSEPQAFTIVVIVYYATLMSFLIRFGFVATLSFLFCHHLLAWMPFTNDLQGPDLAPTILAVVIVLLIAGYGYYTSVGGRPAFEKAMAGRG